MPLAAEMCDGDQQASVSGARIDFPVMNWAIVLLSQFLISITWAIILPSMHQFVTNPTATAMREQNTTSSHSSDEVDVCLYTIRILAFWVGKCPT